MRSTLFALILALSTATWANDPKLDYLTGIKKLACEAMLCLSDPIGYGIEECTPSLDKYFSIVKKKTFGGINKAATEKARAAFLALCPVS